MATYYNRLKLENTWNINTHLNTVVPLSARPRSDKSLRSGLTLNHTHSLASGAVSAIEGVGESHTAGG